MSISLLGKWMPSINTSSKEKVALAKKVAEYLGLSPREYRKMLSTLRKHIGIVESKMSGNEWGAITYPAVPSKAMNNYRDAFAKHDATRFSAFLSSVEKGEAKINSSTLFPYDIVEKILYKGEDNRVLEAQWKALPNYIEGENNLLVMADVSGSMSGRPMATSVGLAIYFAERNSGAFKDVFMTFSSEPEFVRLKGNSLYEKVHNASHAHWQMNTNIEKAMKKVLDVAVENKLIQEELPKALLIISDMEMDRCSSTDKATYYQHMTKMFNDAGYELPKIIFWNVSARNDTFHATIEDGVQFASGQSTSVFKSIIKNTELSAFDFMLETLNDPMYDCVTI